MDLHFITSISKNYWYETGQFCVKTWDLPGKVTVYIDQKEGDLDWIKDVPFHKELLYVPNLEAKVADRAKVRKFWGKSSAQIHALRNRGLDERVIWIDSDVENTSSNTIPRGIFDFDFQEPVAIMNSQDKEDCWESGIVIFNQRAEKFDRFVRLYEKSWLDEDVLLGLWRPYDAQVLGYAATERGYWNLCHRVCSNVDALANSLFAPYFKHWINKDNKKLLSEKNKIKQ